MDFEKDLERLNEFFEKYVCEHQLVELSESEVYQITSEYFEANPIPDLTVRFNFEAITYNRLTGEFEHWFRIPFTKIYWQEGEFFSGVKVSVNSILNESKSVQGKLWRLCVYFGLVD